MGKLNTLKDSLSSAEGKNKELTEKAVASSREAEKLCNEVTSLRSAHHKSSEKIFLVDHRKE